MKGKGKKAVTKVVFSIAFIFLLLFCLNPDRGSFNHSVFDGGRPNPITHNQAIMQKIIEVNQLCYRNENDPRVQRRNYIVLSVYDVQVSDTQTIHVLGILGMFRLLNF